MEECDCESSLSVASFINHRGESMRRDQQRRSRSQGRRTRGLGEVRSFRSRSSEQMSTAEDRSSDWEPSVGRPTSGAPPVTLRRSGAGGPNVLQYNGELFVPVRAVGGGGFVDKHAPTQPGIVVGTDPPTASNLQDYLFYTLRTQPNAREGQRESPLPINAGSVASEAPSINVSCPQCAQLRAKLTRLEREKDILRSEGRSLAQQLKASKRGLQALERSSISEFEEAVYQENEALQEEVKNLRQMLEKAPTGQDGHRGSLADLKDLLHSYLKEEKVELEARLANSCQTIAETQEALLEERRLRREAVSDMERQLVVENAGMKARTLELEHEVRLTSERRDELTAELKEAKQMAAELSASLGKTVGVLPDMSADESEILLAPWCDIPEEVKECMDSPASLQKELKKEDGLTDKNEMIQCLWYRHKVASKALQLLQARLEGLGITSEDKLAELADMDNRLAEKEHQIDTLRSHVKAIAAGQAELAEQNSEKLTALVNERNDLLHKIDDLLSQNRLLDVQRQHAEKANREGLEVLMHRLDESFEGADLRDALERIRAENALLKIGRGDVGEDAQVASIHEVMLLTDPQELRTHCVQLANERDAFLQQLKAERDQNSDAKRQEHARNLEAELVQTVEDRKQLREQVAHFTGQLSEALAKHQEQMTERDRELTVLRLKLQEILQERDEIRVEWEKERRNANDLKVTYHKEIKNQSHQARKEVENEVVELRRKLEAAYKELRSAKMAHNSDLEAHGVVDRLDSVLETLERAADFPKNNADLNSARQMLKELKSSLPEPEDNGEVEEELMMAAKRAPGQFAAREPREDSSVLVDAAARSTDQASSELLRRFNDVNVFSIADPEELRNGVLEMTAKFEDERRLLHQRFELTANDLRAATVRLRAAAEAKTKAEEAAKALERDLSSAQEEEVRGQKDLKEENNRLRMELAHRGANEKALTSLRNRVEQLKRDRNHLRQQAGQRDSSCDELRRKLEKAKSARDLLTIDLKAAGTERDRLRAALVTAQEQSSKLEQQGAVLKEELEQYHRNAKQKNAENFELQEAMMAKDQEAAALRQSLAQLKERLKVEEGQCQRVGEAKALLEAQIKELKTQLFDSGEAGTISDVAQKILELKERVTELRESLRSKDHSSHDLEAQLLTYQQRLEDLDAEMTQERSLLLVAQSRCVTLEDENEWLRTQNEALQRRLSAPRHDVDARSRNEQINDLILRSQTKAQAMLASNPNLVRSLTLNGMLSPTSDVTDHFGLGISRSFDLEH